MLANLSATIKARYRTHQEFAVLAGVHTVRLSRIVNGWIDATSVEREKFARLLQVDAGWLFRRFTVPATCPRTAPDDRGNQEGL